LTASAVIIGAGVLAFLFRVEGIVVLGLSLLFPVFAGARPRLTIGLGIASTAGACVALGLVVWAVGLESGAVSEIDLLIATADRHVESIGDRISALRGILPIFEKHDAAIAYVWLCLLFLATGLLEAIRAQTLILGLFFFASGRDEKFNLVKRFVVIFVGGLALVGLAFSITHFFFVHRYGYLISIIFTIPASIVMADLYREWRKDVWRIGFRSSLFPILMIVFVVDWAAEVPRPTVIGHLREAGLWIAQRGYDPAAVASNDSRILYFAGVASVDNNMGGRMSDATGNPRIAWRGYDIVAISADARSTRRREIKAVLGADPIQVIDGQRNQHVLIYDLRH
jgi:hypothetical protein